MIDLNPHLRTEAIPLLSTRNGNWKRHLLPAAKSSQTRALITNDDVDVLLSVRSQNAIRGLRRKTVVVTKERDEAIGSVRTLHKQQRELVGSFKLLREKYDDVKREQHHILWEFMPTQPAFSEIGLANHAVFESPDRISNYAIGALLGEGQFSDVKLCTHCVTRNQYAVKIIQKQKISTLAGLKRLRTEVKLLRQLDHPNIVKFADYIHSPTCVYILTEVGGKDLFEFFDANPLGADEKVARQIILGIVKPLLYLHDCGICHRDLKPENVLLCEVVVGQEVHHQNIRICDFGQSTIKTSKDGMNLTGLRGSPGFFAPEMIIGGDCKYNGFAADVWSVGCIMLELTRGHDEFCRLWMASYDYDILQEESKFEDSLRQAVLNIELYAESSGEKDMVAFLKNLLLIKPESRLTTSEMLNHEWLNPGDESADDSSYNVDDPNDSTDISENAMDLSAAETVVEEKTPTSRGKRNIFRDSFSSRARKHFAGTNEKGDKVVLNDQSSSCRGYPHCKVEIRLPPIEPDTLSFSTARRNIIESEKIVQNYDSSIYIC